MPRPPTAESNTPPPSPTPTDADLDFVRAVLAGPHDEVELAVLVVGHRDRLLAPLRQLVRDWLASGDPQLVFPAWLVDNALDRLTGAAGHES